MNTLAEVMSPHGVEIPKHLEEQAEVPLISGVQRQGDVIVVPMRHGEIAGLETVRSEGVPVVRGEAGGNTHLLVADGAVSFAPAPSTRGGLALGSLAVEKDAAAYLIHPEHGATGIAPGSYRISRQREQAEIERLVAD